jgi:hypothetical protein
MAMAHDTGSVCQIAAGMAVAEPHGLAGREDVKIQRLALVLTVINLVLLLFALTQAGSTAAQAISPILRARTVELVDDRGQVRSRLNVEPGGAVILRLFDKNGTIRVKLGADEDGSGLLLTDEATEPGVHLIARRTGTTVRPTTTSITLTGAEGQQHVIMP